MSGAPTAFTPADPAFAETIAANFRRQGLMSTLGARLETVEPGHVTIVADFHDGLSQQQGFFHGGVIGAIGDSAGGYATLTLFPRGSDVVTVEYKVNFIRPARGVRLIADGHVLRSGRSITVGRIDVAVEDGAGGRTLVAVLQATFMRVEPAAP